MSRVPRKPAAPQVQIGTVVGLINDLGLVREAVITEDRGHLGRGGEQMVRLSYQIEGADGEFEIEVPISRLTDPPTEPYIDQWWRLTAPLRAQLREERRRARRAATA